MCAKSVYKQAPHLSQNAIIIMTADISAIVTKQNAIMKAVVWLEVMLALKDSSMGRRKCEKLNLWGLHRFW